MTDEKNAAAKTEHCLQVLTNGILTFDFIPKTITQMWKCNKIIPGLEDLRNFATYQTHNENIFRQVLKFLKS